MTMPNLYLDGRLSDDSNRLIITREANGFSIQAPQRGDARSILHVFNEPKAFAAWLLQWAEIKEAETPRCDENAKPLPADPQSYYSGAPGSPTDKPYRGLLG